MAENKAKVKSENRKKALNIALAIVMAVILWAYVIGEVNPETSKTLNGVTLTVSGKNALSQQELVLLTDIEPEVSVVIKGRRSDIAGMSAEKLSAKIDVSECVEGENIIPIRVTAPGSVTEAEAKEGSLKVFVDRIVTAEKPVKIVLSGNLSTGDDVTVTGISSETIEVTGPSTYIDEIDRLEGALTVNDAIDDYDRTVNLKAVDSDGNEVKGVTLASTSVEVTGSKSVTKTVDVRVNLVDDDDNVSVALSDDVKLKIKGRYDIIGNIDYLTAEPVDVTYVLDDMNVNLLIKLPEGVTAVNNSGKEMKKNESGAVTIRAGLTVTKNSQDTTSGDNEEPEDEEE